MATAVGLMTVEEFRNLPEIEGAIAELRTGEVVLVTRPKKRHDDCVYRIRQALAPIADPIGYLDREFSCRPLPEHELRVAALAFVSWDRWDATPSDDNLHGAPDFVVEVISPSNTADEIHDKKDLCLATGCREFWAVYPKSNTIEVTTASATHAYRPGDTITSTVFGHSFPVSDLLSRRLA